MKFSTVVNSIKEALLNTVRHPLATIATVSTITLMLSVMGAFVIFSENAKELAKSASQQPPVLVWADYDLDEDTILGIKEKIAQDKNVKSYTMQTSEDNFEIFKTDLGEDSGVLEGFDPGLLPYTFTVLMEETSFIDEFRVQMEGVPGVRKVEYSQPVTEFLNSIRVGINSVTMIAFLILCGITLFIISNMVRIAVLARGEEIGIMKYVGSTNTYIRVPFILEGILTGFLGAVFASGVSLTLYFNVLNKSSNVMNGISFLKLIPLDAVSNKVIFINLALGIIIGAVGSGISVRKHIKV